MDVDKTRQSIFDALTSTIMFLGNSLARVSVMLEERFRAKPSPSPNNREEHFSIQEGQGPLKATQESWGEKTQNLPPEAWTAHVKAASSRESDSYRANDPLQAQTLRQISVNAEGRFQNRQSCESKASATENADHNKVVREISPRKSNDPSLGTLPTCVEGRAVASSELPSAGGYHQMKCQVPVDFETTVSDGDSSHGPTEESSDPTLQPDQIRQDLSSRYERWLQDESRGLATKHQRINDMRLTHDFHDPHIPPEEKSVTFSGGTESETEKEKYRITRGKNASLTEESWISIKNLDEMLEESAPSGVKDGRPSDCVFSNNTSNEEPPIFRSIDWPIGAAVQWKVGESISSYGLAQATWAELPREPYAGSFVDPPNWRSAAANTEHLRTISKEQKGVRWNV